jgi:hypothetical protein
MVAFELIDVAQLESRGTVGAPIDSILRLWADNFELAARNYEKGLEAFSTVIEQQNTNSRREAA